MKKSVTESVSRVREREKGEERRKREKNWMERPFSHQTKQSRERHLGPSGKVRIKRSGPPNCRNQILRRLEGRIDLRQKQPQFHPQVS